MLSINGSKIRLTRGDSAYIGIVPKVNGVVHELNENESLHLQVRNADSDGDLVFNGNIIESQDYGNVWYIAPRDTADLPIGRYYWDVELHVGDDIFTFISGQLILTNEVTREQ